MSKSQFPDPNTASPYGLVAITDELTPEILIDAYTHGIFPWTENPVRWFSPDPRAVFILENIKPIKRLSKIMRTGSFRVTYDLVFEEVITACATTHADDGRWITDGFLRAYTALHHRGYAHSVEVWQNQDLVGGLYGVQIGAMFAGESMFYRASNASKVAFSFLVQHLRHLGVTLFDAQVPNPHTTRLGAITVRRRAFLGDLKHAVLVPTPFAGKKWPTHA